MLVWQTPSITYDFGLLFKLFRNGGLLGQSRGERCLDLVDFGLEDLQFLRVDALVLGQDGLVTSLPAFVVFFEEFDLVILRFEFGLKRPELLLERLDLGLHLAELRVEGGQLAHIGFVLIAQGLVALAQEFGGVNRFEQFGVLSRAAEGIAGPLSLLQPRLVSLSHCDRMASWLTSCKAWRASSRLREVKSSCCRRRVASCLLKSSWRSMMSFSLRKYRMTSRSCSTELLCDAVIASMESGVAEESEASPLFVACRDCKVAAEAVAFSRWSARMPFCSLSSSLLYTITHHQRSVNVSASDPRVCTHRLRTSANSCWSTS